jgi:ComF family protein
LAAKATKKIKYAGQEPLANALGAILGQWLNNSEILEDAAFDWIIPIPQHWIRRITTRYNQAEVLAERVSKALDVPLNRKLLIRTRLTEKQGTKSIQQRLSTVHHSFGCQPKKSLDGCRVLLVDDVVTSGATVDDAARALRKAGAECVEVAAFARGVGAIKNNTPETMVRDPLAI